MLLTFPFGPELLCPRHFAGLGVWGGGGVGGFEGAMGSEGAMGAEGAMDLRKLWAHGGYGV